MQQQQKVNVDFHLHFSNKLNCKLLLITFCLSVWKGITMLIIMLSLMNVLVYNWIFGAKEKSWTFFSRFIVNNGKQGKLSDTSERDLHSRRWHLFTNEKSWEEKEMKFENLLLNNWLEAIYRKMWVKMKNGEIHFPHFAQCFN